MKHTTLLLSFFILSITLHAENACEEYYLIQTQKKQQTIDCFGASDAWSMLHVGLWPIEKQQRVADWLFSTKTDKDGNPLGIGLSLWRFNLGAGSAYQGKESQISRGTRTECFLMPDGTYDWNRQAGQRNFLKLAKERGVNQFLAFLNSPPIYYAENGLATNTGRGGSLNLKKDCYDDFARFMADVIEGVEKHDSIHFSYICPVNEPDGHWNWQGPKQEGSPATKYEIANLVRIMSKEFSQRNIRTEILINESSDYRCMMNTHMTDHRRGYQIQSFFCPDSTETYVSNLPNVAKKIAGHSYWTNTPLHNLQGYRQQLRDTLNKYDVDFWQTETCIMSNDTEIGGGGGYDFTMKTALYVARIIHYDLVVAGARSWQWWRAMGGDYKDGLLRMYTNRNTLNDGEAKDSKLLWAMGNYSHFIRPGAKRLQVGIQNEQLHVEVNKATNPKALMCSAYENVDGSKVIVVINYDTQDHTFRFKTDTHEEQTWSVYRTSDNNNENLSLIDNRFNNQTSTQLPARSITTFVCSVQ